jgi:2-oxoglutarate ferredoxin oxidoreductase subunit gamma
VVIADAPIHYPKAQKLDILLAMTQESCDRYFHDLKFDGILITDLDLVPNPPTSAALAVPITRLVREALGRELFANIAALGVLTGATSVVGAQAMEAALLARVPRGTETANKQAFFLGLEAGLTLTNPTAETDYADN